MVRWKGKWYKARVLQVGNRRWFIHYKGYSASWNQWVGPHRIRPRFAPMGPRYVVGQRVMVFWKTRWYKARVLAARPGSWLIHYKGYGSNWNEWVGPGRIRPRQNVVPQPVPRPVPQPVPHPVPRPHFSVDVRVGPIWNQRHAMKICPRIASTTRWTGRWKTTIQGRMSVCNCKAAMSAFDVPAGPIWNQGHANKRCPRVCSRARWSGQWKNIRQGRMSVCNLRW
ncbi:MAG: hypothetical protein KC609_06020 [Myxococcales bacterium]|nr:hypothetical protein [Myxococcales bacterium]